MTFRILLADDSASVRDGIKRLISCLSGQFELCGEAADGHEVIRKSLELQPDVLLLDVSIPLLSGVEVVKSLRQTSFPGTVILMSQQEERVLKYIAESVAVAHYVAKARLATDLPAVLQKATTE